MLWKLSRDAQLTTSYHVGCNYAKYTHTQRTHFSCIDNFLIIYFFNKKEGRMPSFVKRLIQS